MKRFLRCTAGAFIASVCGVSLAQPFQVNGSGATLFVDYLREPAATNDWIDVDGDGLFGFYDSDVPPDGVPDSIDQLAPSNRAGAWWLAQYRSVGSVEGYDEFIVFQNCGNLPEVIPSERGIINTLDFAITGVPSGAAGGPPCTDDTDADGIPNASNTPVCPTTIDYANIDVPSVWATRGGDPANAAWNRKPGSDGYGFNAIVSDGDPACNQQGESALLSSLATTCAGGTVRSLNTNFGNPDANTIYDTGIAWSPVCIIANRGTNLNTDCDASKNGAIRYTDAQHGFVVGRMANGENLAFATRDVGSGTRNGMMNPLGIDPSGGIGDNVGRRINNATLTTLGPCHQINNCGGSSIMESSVQNRRLAVGYTGFFGASRAVEDAPASRYELVGLIKDIDGDGDGNIDGSAIVRPTLEAILDNGNPNTGYQIGGIQTLVTRGNPRAHDFGPRAPQREIGPLMTNTQAARFVRNIEESIAAVTVPLPPLQFNMPGDVLTAKFAPVAAVDVIPPVGDPTDYRFVNASLNQDIQDYVRNNNIYRTGGSVEPPPWGDCDDWPNCVNPSAQAPAGLVPTRRAPMAGTYSDGGTTAYRYKDAGGALVTIGSGRLSARNAVAGDMNNDGRRNVQDTPKLIEAYDLFTNAVPGDEFDFEPIQGGNPGGMLVDRLIVHVVADFDGNGDFDAQDIRYFADGLALSAAVCQLDRKAGFVAVDNAWLARTGDINFFDTVLATGAAYTAGAARGDVFGNPAGPTPGAAPTGADGIVNLLDIEYVQNNPVADWRNLDQAYARDLSCDMDGDLDVDCADVRELVEDVLRTRLGDIDLDGDVDQADLLVIENNVGNAGNYGDGDLNCDGVVDHDDLLIARANLTCAGIPTGDANGSGAVNNFDIDFFVLALADPDGYIAATNANQNEFYCRLDINGDGFVNNFDIDPFVNCLTSGCP
ncbi:MAG: hypothetical protein AB7Q17_01780 [Phycisphaerae bacterium]